MVTYPSDWEKVQLANLIIKGGSGGTPNTSKEEYYKGKIPFLSITDTTNSNGYIYKTEKSISELGLNSSAAWIVPAEALTLAMYASVGKVAILKKDIATSQAFYNMIFSDLGTRDFVYYYLKKFDRDNLWNPLISTGTQANLNAKKIRNLEIFLPPLPEQQAIASALSDFDEHIDNLSDLIEKKKAIRDGALEDLVSGRTRLDGFNGEWVEMTLEDICVPNGLVRGPFGGSLKKEMFVSKGNKVYEQRNAIYKSVRIGDYYISNGKYNELSRFAVKADDFIVSCSGTIGKIFKIPKQYKRGIINQALLKISIDQTKCNLNYFYKYFEWDKFQDSIIDNTQGGAMKNLVGMDIFRKTVILMPRDITEQKAIAQIISAMDEEIESLKIEKEKMLQIKEGAMDDLLTGRVRLKV